MSRSGYTEDYDDQWAQICWRGAVASAVRGKRGQAFLRELLLALDGLPEKKLIAGDLEADGVFCALGAVGNARGVDMANIDPEDSPTVAGVFGVAEALAREVVYMNDEFCDMMTPERRFAAMRKWVASQIVGEAAA